MKRYVLHWLTGQTQVIEGDDISDAMNRAGIGNGALPALDWWDEYREPIDEAAQS